MEAKHSRINVAASWKDLDPTPSCHRPTSRRNSEALAKRAKGEAKTETLALFYLSLSKIPGAYFDAPGEAFGLKQNRGRVLNKTWGSGNVSKGGTFCSPVAALVNVLMQYLPNLKIRTTASSYSKASIGVGISTVSLSLRTRFLQTLFIWHPSVQKGIV
jgi:hypothetical protein